MKNFSNHTRSWMAVLALAAASITGFAQGPGGPMPGGPGRGPGPGGPGGPGLVRGLAGFLGDAVDLTDAQRAQIRAIADQTRQSNEAIEEQMHAIHEQEEAAVKAGKSEQELRTIAQSAVPLLTQLHAARLIADAKAYAVLTAAQKAKIEKMRPPRP